MGAHSQDPPAGASDTNQELVVRLAVGALAGKGWIEEETRS
jgi:hypothetical protein